jgi:hypothetical protein
LRLPIRGSAAQPRQGQSLKFACFHPLSSIGLTEAGRLLASSLREGTPSRCVFYTPSRDFSRLA